MTAAAKEAREVSADDVIAFLKKQKTFFRDNPDLFEELISPGVERGRGVADFQAALVAKLQSDRQDAHRVQRELVETFRANMSNQNRIHTAVLVILEAETFEEFIMTLTQDLPVLLDVDTVNVVIEATSKEVPFVNQSGIRFARPGFVKGWLGEGDALLQANVNGHEDIFGPGAGLVKSHALMRMEISANTPSGILAFGSRNPEAFQPDQAIDQVGFLAQVVERCFRIWLDVQA